VLLEASCYQAVYHGARTAGRFRIAARVATARGRSHAYEGTAGQDVAGVVWNEARRAIFAVVADGLGSKVDSGLVAREVVEHTLARAEHLGQADDPAGMTHHVLSHVARAVRNRALDGATTVVIAEIRSDQDGAIVSTWGIGDSEAWLLEDREWKVLHHERRTDGENITRHLPGHAEVRSRRARVRPGAVVTLASDGFAGALGSTSRMARDLTEQWRTPPAPTDFLSQVNFEDPYFNDDRAAVSVWIR
jgi:serine/threonine protein phosphatase PrpC